MEEWGLVDKGMAVVHVNAANVRRIGEGANAIDVGCAAHTLQLCVNAALDSPLICNMRAVATRLVGHFKHSMVASKGLESKQKQLGLPEHKLIQAVKTRWNSS